MSYAPDVTAAALDPDALEEAWLLYKETGLELWRNRLVLHYTSLIRYVVAKKAGGLPPEVDREDLIAYGMFGLLDAIEKFDMSKGVKFETYAFTRIWFSIVDEIRSVDWVPRSIRSKARELATARADLEARLGRPPDAQEVAQELGLSIESYRQLVAQANISVLESSDRDVRIGSDGDSGSYDTRHDAGASPEERVETSEIVELMAEAVVGMDERSKTILVLYYLYEMTLADIGKILGVTESRVCQLQSKALGSLRDSLGQGGLAA